MSLIWPNPHWLRYSRDAVYGAVAMEVFGHLRFALEDPAPMFEITLGDLASLIGLRYPL